MKTKTESRAKIAASSVFIGAFMFLMSPAGKLWAHEDLHTHPALTVGAFLFLDQAASEDGAFFVASARGRARQASIDEDVCPNYISHFFIPRTGENGTPDLVPPPLLGGCTRPDGFVQQTAPARASDFWTGAAGQFRLGNTNNAMTRLGHVLHLLQDMSSPAHVHADIHGEGDTPGCQDTDDFENWGWSNCPDHGRPFTNIFDYLTSSVSADYLSTNQIRTNMASGLSKIFKNQPQHASIRDNENAGYAYVRDLAEKVYDFTSFEVILQDTPSLANDQGAGELKGMFPSLIEDGSGWFITNLGWSAGDCGNFQDQDWWLMEDHRCHEVSCGFRCKTVSGYAYIENTGGGDGGGAAIPDTLRPAKYNRSWFIDRYGSSTNSGSRTMLRIYGDVLYTAAVAYGAGLLQAFLDEAVMPRPITVAPIMMDGFNVRLNGHAHPGGTNAMAWFEWHLDGGLTNRTPAQSIGDGSSWVGAAARIQGLNPETTYYCRLVSSNRFGIRYSTNQVFRTPSYILAANGMNAWQITDNSEAAGSFLSYTTKLSAAQHVAATTNGWKLTVTSRLVTDFGDTISINASYGMGSKRFLFWLDLDASGDLTVLLDGQSARKLTTNGFGATDYHTHEIQYANGVATYRFDGTLVESNWTGLTLNNPAGAISWGAGSSPGRGQMNFHRVEFAIGGTNIVAAYNAGSAGNPAEAPNPVSQGWMRLAGATLLSEGPLSPDGESSLVGAETLTASGLGLQGAQLNGRVDPRGSAAVTWFEWGLDPSYGTVTAPQQVSAGHDWVNVDVQLGALTQDTTYHYRIVASNAFGIRFGTNRTFITPSYLLTGAIPNAWQITDNDNSPATGHTLRYTNTLPVSLRNTATTNGWRLTTTSRFITDYGDTMSITVSYVQGGTRFLFWLDLDSDGDLTVLLDGQSARKLTTNGAGATNYHTHQVHYVNGAASYWFDGTLVVSNWVGIPTILPDWPAGQISWGATSSGGRGQMNFHRVEFAIGGSNIVAAYDAGSAGNPIEAPNPATQGWMLSAGPGPTSTPLSPDAVPFQPIADAETLAATAAGPNTAQLNAGVNPQGQPTVIWFEWGTTPSYGNRTAVQNLGGSGATPFAQGISGLAVDMTYHYRVVASNAFAVSFGSAQTFRTRWFQDAGIALAAVDVGSVAWGDYDNDGYLDLIITGQADTNQVTSLYRNVGGTNLIPVNSGLPPVNQSAVAWGDYDNDGYLDLAISGWRAAGAISRIYRNTQDGTFENVNAGLPGLRWSSVTWSDYDNDGDLDFLLTGLDDTTTNAVAQLYRNDRGTNFVDINAGLPGVIQGAAAWADFDGDGDQDLVLTGRNSSQIQISRIYRNDGGGNFSDIAAELEGVDAGSVAWGDYDSDGDPDLLLTGWDGGSPITHLYRNERNGSQSTFVDVQANLPGVAASSVTWGDYDNDGDIDIVMAGWSGTYSARILRNDGGEIFVDIGAELTGVNWSSAAWADYDNDGDLDLLVTGSIDGGRVCRFYQNGASSINAPPTPPTGLAGSGMGSTATLSWNPAIDDKTPEALLGYNVFLATTTNGSSFTSPMSDLVSGFRRVARSGNANQNLAWTFNGLTPGTYYFTVQAIDGAFAGGPFAPWQRVEVASLPVGIIGTTVPLPGQFRLQIIAAEGSACEVLRSADLTTWSVIGLAIEVSAGLFEFLDTAAPAQGAFYRVRSTTP